MKYEGTLYAKIGGKFVKITDTTKIDILEEKSKKLDEIKDKIAGYFKHNDQFFSPSILETLGEDIVKMFGYLIH
jgi:hypothetical protein